MRTLGTNFGVVQRRKGQSASARSTYGHSGVTYRSGKERISTPLDCIISHRVFIPVAAASKYRDAATLWESVALAEVRKDAVEARTFELTLPRGLSVACMNDIGEAVASLFVELGVPCQCDLHITTARDGKPNPHQHFLVGERSLGETGFAAVKSEALQDFFRENYGRFSAGKSPLSSMSTLGVMGIRTTS